MGTIKKNAYIRDKKTNKPNILYLKPVKQDLLDYYAWLQNNNIQSEWLFHQSLIKTNISLKNNSIRLWPKQATYLASTILVPTSK